MVRGRYSKAGGGRGQRMENDTLFFHEHIYLGNACLTHKSKNKPSDPIL